MTIFTLLFNRYIRRLNQNAPANFLLWQDSHEYDCVRFLVISCKITYHDYCKYVDITDYTSGYSKIMSVILHRENHEH